MFAQLRARARAWLGTHHLEDHMTTILEMLHGLAAQTGEASAAQQASFLNLHNAIARLDGQVADLTRQVAEGGQITEEMQTLGQQVSQSLTDMKQAADTADNGFEPIPEPVVDSGEGEPVAEAGGNVVQPVDGTEGAGVGTDEVPAEQTPADETTRRRR